MIRFLAGTGAVICAAIIGLAFSVVTYGSGMEDRVQFAGFFVIGLCGGVLAAYRT